MAFLKLLPLMLLLGAPALVQSAQVASCGGCTFSTDAAGNLTRNTCNPASCTGTLDLSSKSIISLDQGVFSGLQITYLGFGNNNISVLPEGLFAGLSSLQSLGFDNNQISVLPEGLFAGLSSLQYLGLGNNNISVLPEGLFAGLSSLRSLSFDNNQISVLPEGLFAGLSSLQYLYFYNTQISVLPEGLFAGLSSLQYLFLNNNPLVCRLNFPVAPLNSADWVPDTSYNDLELCKNPPSQQTMKRWGEDVALANCTLGMTPQELATSSNSGEMLVRTGGLGPLTESGRFDTWVCVQPHACCVGSQLFCFVYDRAAGTFVPWGKAEDLLLSLASCA